MPKSKRARVVHTSKTQKKGKELTIRLHANIQECVPKYPYIYVFSVDNMRNTYLKDVRTQLHDSRLFFGKTKVMAVALGLTAATEPYPGTSLLSPYLNGEVGLVFSPRPPHDMVTYFDSFNPSDYARSGTIASRSFSIPSGIVHSRAGEIPHQEDVPLAHSIEPNLRRLGVPTTLVKGKVVLESEEPFVVCTEGQKLGSGQTSLLKMFGVTMAKFKISVVAWWERKTGQVTALEDGLERIIQPPTGGEEDGRGGFDEMVSDDDDT
ncbi:mRNA turnover and ribosome assembly protein [Lecanora helva]